MVSGASGAPSRPPEPQGATTMLDVTDAALEHLHRALSGIPARGPACFRMSVRGQESLSLVIQSAEDDDRKFDYEGTTVLAMPERLLDVLAERVLDLDDDGHLVLVPKNV